MLPKGIIITNLSSGEKAVELWRDLEKVINEYEKFLTGFELIGVVDAVKVSVHDILKERDEED